MTTFAIGLPHGMDWPVLLILALLLFGKRLPEVGRSLGQGLVEFKRGLKGVQDEIEEESNRPAPRPRAQPLPEGGAAGFVQPPAAPPAEQVRVSRSDVPE